jgi:hypothetical protein
MKRIVLFMVVGLLVVTNMSGKQIEVQASKENDEKVVTVETIEEAEITELVEKVSAVEEVEVLDLKELLYHTWELSTDDIFEYDTWTEDVNENMLACAEEYTIDSTKIDENGNFVMYWHTDYMKAKLAIFADREFRYIEANYFVEEDNDYTGDTLYFRR